MRLKPSQLVPVVTRSVVGVVALASAVGLYVLLVETKPNVEAADPDRFAQRLAVYPLRSVELRRPWLGYGTAEAKLAAEVPARVTAVVVDRPEGVRAGRAVRKGQVLVKLDPADFEQELAAAEQASADLDAQLDDLDLEEKKLGEQLDIEERDRAIAQREFARLQELYDRGAANRADVDARESALLNAERSVVASRDALARVPTRRAALRARLDAQRATAAAARLALGRTEVVSPIAGVLQRVDVEVGESVTPGQPVARVVDPSVIEVPLKLPAAAAGRVAVGDAVTLREFGDDDRAWSSAVVRVAPEQDPVQRTITVFAEVRQEAGGDVRLAPGSFLEGVVRAREPRERWAVPRRAVRRGRVFVVEDRVVHSVAVETRFEVDASLPGTGLDDSLWAVIDNAPDSRRPLADGDLVVLNASARLADGQRAEVEVVGAALGDAGTVGAGSASAAATGEPSGDGP